MRPSEPWRVECNNLESLLVEDKTLILNSMQLPVVIVTGGANTKAIAKDLRAWLKCGKIDCEIYPEERGLIPDVIEALRSYAETNKVKSAISVGSGRVTDLTKTAGVPWINFVTAISNDAMASATASVLDEHNNRISIRGRTPSGVVAMWDLIKRAPTNTYGVPEILSNYTATCDMGLSTCALDEIDAMYLSRLSAVKLLQHLGYGARVRDVNSDEHTLKILFGSLCDSARAMVLAGSSRPCSGAEHKFYHAVMMLKPEIEQSHGPILMPFIIGCAYLHHRYVRPDNARDLYNILMTWGRRTRNDFYTLARRVGKDMAYDGMSLDNPIDYKVFRDIGTALGLPISIYDLGLKKEDFPKLLDLCKNIHPNRKTILDYVPKEKVIRNFERVGMI